VISGESQVCPDQIVTYNISTGGPFYNNYMDITASGGTIISVDFNPSFPKGIYSNGTKGWVDSGIHEMGDGTVTVRWGAGGTGVIRANVRYNIGIFGGQQWNSDQIDVSNGLGSMGSISGATAISCGVSTSNYSISPVLGADYYSWTSSSPNISLVSGGGLSATFNVSNFTGSATITVTALNNYCGIVKSRTISVSRVPARGSVMGSSEVCSGSQAYYIATDGSSYSELVGSNFVWSLPFGWSIINGFGTAIIDVQVPTYSSGLTRTVSLRYTANDACGNPVSGSMSVTMLPNGSCPEWRVAPPDEIKDKETLFSLYPNPSQDNVTLSCGTEEIGTLKIYDKLGTEVATYTNVSNGFMFSVAKFATDMYSVQFITKETVKTFRLSVNHN
jgi:hypothetical protein